MTCNDCDALNTCKNPDGTTRFMDKDAACACVESLCGGFRSPKPSNCDILVSQEISSKSCERYYHVVYVVQSDHGAGINSFQLPSAEPIVTCDGLKNLQKNLSEQLNANVHILNIIKLDEV